MIVLQETWAPDGGVAQHDEVADGPRHATCVVGADGPVRRSSPSRSWSAGPTPTGRPGDGDWCLALLSRKPIRATRAIAAAAAARSTRRPACLLHAEIDVDGTNLTVVATHFTHLEFGSPLQTRALRRGPAAGGPAGACSSAT